MQFDDNDNNNPNPGKEEEPLLRKNKPLGGDIHQPPTPVPNGLYGAEFYVLLTVLSEFLYFAFVLQSNDKATTELQNETHANDVSNQAIVFSIAALLFVNKWGGSISNLLIDLFAVNIIGDAKDLYDIVVNLFKPKSLKEKINTINLAIAIPSFLVLSGADPVAFARIMANTDEPELVKSILMWVVGISTLLLGTGYYAAWNIGKLDKTADAMIALHKDIIQASAEDRNATLKTFFQPMKIPAVIEASARATFGAAQRGVLAKQSAVYLAESMLGLSKDNPYVSTASWILFGVTAYTTLMTRALPTVEEYLNREYDNLKLKYNEFNKFEMIFDGFIALIRGAGATQLINFFLTLENEELKLGIAILSGLALTVHSAGTSYLKNIQKTALEASKEEKAAASKNKAGNTPLSKEEQFKAMQKYYADSWKYLLVPLNIAAGETRAWSFPLFLSSVFPEMDFVNRVALAGVVGLPIYILDRKAYYPGTRDAVTNYLVRIKIYIESGYDNNLLKALFTAPVESLSDNAVADAFDAIQSTIEKQKTAAEAKKSNPSCWANLFDKTATVTELPAVPDEENQLTASR